MDTDRLAPSCSVVSPPSKTSAVWQHFGFAKDDHGKLINDSRVICKLCGQKVAHGGGTTNLRNHLCTKHRPTYNELVAGSSTEREQSSLDEFVRPTQVKRLPPYSTRAAQLTDAVADFIVRDLRPVSVVDGEGFLQLMEIAEPQFVVPCRKTIMNVIDRKYTEVKRTVRGAMTGQNCVTLTTDMWTSHAGNGYFSLTAHYITSDFEMKHSSLQCHHMPGTHDHSHIAEAISTSTGEWCIDLERDVTAFTTDNGSNIVKAVEQDLGKLRLPCAGHTLNLSVQKAFEVHAVQKAVSRSKKIVEHFNKSRLHRVELQSKQEMLGLPKHNLIQVCYTVCKPVFSPYACIMYYPAKMLSIMGSRYTLSILCTFTTGSTTQVELYL